MLMSSIDKREMRAPLELTTISLVYDGIDNDKYIILTIKYKPSRLKKKY